MNGLAETLQGRIHEFAKGGGLPFPFSPSSLAFPLSPRNRAPSLNQLEGWEALQAPLWGLGRRGRSPSRK